MCMDPQGAISRWSAAAVDGTFIFRRNGIDGFDSFAPPSVLPDISPTGGEIGRHAAFANLQRWRMSGRLSCRSPPLWGRCPAGQRGALSRQPRAFWAASNQQRHHPRIRSRFASNSGVGCTRAGSACPTVRFRRRRPRPRAPSAHSLGPWTSSNMGVASRRYPAAHVALEQMGSSPRRRHLPLRRRTRAAAACRLAGALPAPPACR